MFGYCTRVLHLSEHAAYGRIEAARLARRFPVILDRLADGSLTLTATALLAPHLTADNHQAMLDAARHRSKREDEQLVATVRPRPDVPATIRKLPAPKPSVAIAPPVEVTPNGASDTAAALLPVAAEPPAPRPAPRAVLQPLAPSVSRCSSRSHAPRTTS